MDHRTNENCLVSEQKAAFDRTRFGQTLPSVLKPDNSHYWLIAHYEGIA